MHHPNRFFGYGSLVNQDTHHRPLSFEPMTLKGWRRSWDYRIDEDNLENSSGVKIVTLTADPCPDCEIDGLLVDVNPKDWDVLDAREFGYDRLKLDEGYIYSTQPDKRGGASEGYVMLQSYIDAVCQGYLRVFGEDGLKRFFETTDGWGGDILADRDKPLYPRSVVLEITERETIDAMLEIARS